MRARPVIQPAAPVASGGAAGFTLLEMLVVMALIGVLMGMGVGFLRRSGDDFEVALAAIRDRAAQLALLDKRREAILKSLEEQKLLTDELK